MTNKHLRRRRNSFLATQSSFESPADATLFVHAWCSAVQRMSQHQLRERGSALLEVWQANLGDFHSTFEHDAPEKEISPSDYPKLLESLARQHHPRRKPKSSRLSRRIDWLAHALGLDPTERTIILVLARFALHDEWEQLAHALPGSGRNATPLGIAFLADLRASLVEDRLGVGARLWRTGMIDNDGDGEISASRFLQRIARSTSPPSRLAQQLMPVAPCSTLSWRDFDHIGPQREIAEALVANDRGAAILLYGPPGTGKTEFARLIADRTGKRAIFAGAEDENGREPSRPERLAHFAILRALTRGDMSRIVVMDEADDVLQLGLSEGRGGRSKMFLNGLVQDQDFTTIWIVNEPGRFEESLIRRMTLAVEFPTPPLNVRRRVVERQAAAVKLKVSEADIVRLASLPAAPAVIASAVRGAKRSGGGPSDALAIGEGLVTAIQGRPPTPVALPSAYDPALALADVDLDALAARLTAAPERGWSLLLSGPSGTGKSAFARYLAERLEIELIVRRGSDLLGMYVGQTEANIARAFRDAARAGGLLLIDEADDFLFDRRDARRSWERSMVNEMLRQMEALEAPFVATTNLCAQLDPATQRRFTVRATFRALGDTRAADLFCSWFGQPMPAGISLADTTPGDFSVVADRAKLLGEHEPVVLATWLMEEREARGDNRKSIGF